MASTRRATFGGGTTASADQGSCVPHDRSGGTQNASSPGASVAVGAPVYRGRMDPEAVRARLEDERRRALGQLRSSDAGFDEIVAAARDSNLDDEHDPEGATIAVERSMISSLGDAARRRLAQVDAALVRLDDGSYGTCVACGRPIGAGRLEALPATPVCVACA